MKWGTVSYLECAKGGPSSMGTDVPSGDRGPQKLRFFVNECLNFDVLEKIVNVKNTARKIRVG